jgi:hypothetical protein
MVVGLKFDEKAVEFPLISASGGRVCVVILFLFADIVIDQGNRDFLPAFALNRDQEIRDIARLRIFLVLDSGDSTAEGFDSWFSESIFNGVGFGVELNRATYPILHVHCSAVPGHEAICFPNSGRRPRCDGNGFGSCWVMRDGRSQQSDPFSDSGVDSKPRSQCRCIRRFPGSP